MSTPEYIWRQLTPGQREEVLAWRKERGHPWHSPPHRPNFGHLHFLVSGACYEHTNYIGHNPQRLEAFRTNGPGRSATGLERVSYTWLREKVGCRGNVSGQVRSPAEVWSPAFRRLRCGKTLPLNTP